MILQKEAHQLIDQINDNALVQFNGKYLLNGTKNNVLKKQGTKTVFLNQNLQLEQYDLSKKIDGFRNHDRRIIGH